MRRLSILYLFLLVSFFAACSRSGQVAEGAAPQAMPVKVQAVQEESVGEYTEYLSTLRSRDSSILQPQVEGHITQIYVKAGDKVAAGQPLLQIDPLKQQATVTSQEASARAREAALVLAEQELRRKKQLAEEGVISRQELDQAQSAYDSARSEVAAMGAAVREQQAQLRYYTVRAPAAGTVGDIPVRVGDRVTTSTVLTTVDKRGELEAYISIPTEKAGDVRQGMKVQFLDESGKPVGESRINFISPRVDNENQLLLVKAPVPNDNGRYRNAQIVHVRVLWSEAKAPVVPVLAVSRISGEIFAFVAEDEGGKTVAKQRMLKVGDVVGNNYVVTDGVKPGERLITTNVQMLADGMPIAPQS